MNTILALTDFSEAADNALRYAVALAQRTDASLTIMNVYQLPVTMSDVPVMLITADEVKKNADRRLEQTREELVKQYNTLTIQTESLLGDIVYEVQDWCKQNAPLAIVIGTQESSGAERFFFGSSANALVRHLTQPVFTVPATYTHYRFTNAVLATDLSNKEAFPANAIVSLFQHLDVNLQVIHIDQNDAVEPFSIQELDSLEPNYKWIKEEEDVNNKLLEIVQQPETDLFVVLPHEHNLIERLFFNLHTEKLLRHTSKPILTIRN